ncbi:flagellar export chaperone FliS [Paenibacillus sp. Leaf72]|uniref:flagellar export chaperone FliS n=1 Tax=Paenibacillus sp. Leaf72 TaxID=1736234 RepID=UPI0006FFBDB5|nr:flagellar export chaperone FliS [Paenibacillus sp. Leaf72]KQO11011.1 flagellar export chaperone FliS [Paenibacillus sp. Leaf72]
MINSPYQIYKQSSVQTAAPEQLIIMLYDGAIRFIKGGIEGIRTRNYEQANVSLQKCQSIINELIAALNFDIALSKELYRIYEYMLHLTIQANVKKDTVPAEEALSYLEGLRDTWREVIKGTTSTIQLQQSAE